MRNSQRASAMAAAIMAPALLAFGLWLSIAAAGDEDPYIRSGRGSEMVDYYGWDVVGEPLPDWHDLRFLDPPHQRKLKDFRGQVLVIRFWTGGCPFCRTSAPTLSNWAERYDEDDLVVIGIYHPKPPRQVSDKTVRQLAETLELKTVLARDDDWSVLERLWLRGKRRGFTSVTLLVDHRGIVRAVHRGGSLTPLGDRSEVQAYSVFADSLETVLAETKKPKIKRGAKKR